MKTRIVMDVKRFFLTQRSESISLTVLEREEDMAIIRFTPEAMKSLRDKLNGLSLD